MSRPESLRNDGFDIAAEQGVARVSKHAFRLVVHPEDTAIGVDDKNGVGRRVDQAAEVPLALIPALDLSAQRVVRCRQFGGSFLDPFFEIAAGCSSASIAWRREALRADGSQSPQKRIVERVVTSRRSGNRAAQSGNSRRLAFREQSRRFLARGR